MKQKISYKLILAVGSVTITIIGVFSYIIISSQKHSLTRRIEHNAYQISETIKSSTKYDMMLNQRESVHHIIDTLGKQDGIEKIRIFNKAGKVIYSSDKSDIGKFVDKQAESCFACHIADQPLSKLSIPDRTRIFKTEDKIKNLGIINPIYNEPGCSQNDCHAHKADQKVLGVLDVTMSLAAVESQINTEQMRMVIFAASAIILISFILWLFVQKLVGKPVKELVEATHIVSTGNLTYEMKAGVDDELGHLKSSFNKMVHKLSETQRQLYQSDKLTSLGRLAVGIAHEINNPLTGVLTYSSHLQKSLKDDPETQQNLKVIIKETKRCREIVKGILNFVRQVPSKKSNISINDVINQALKILGNELRLRNIRVHKLLNKNLPLISVDENQIQQVLINLIENAADAMSDEGGEITISTEEEKINESKYIQIKITDTGKGISQKNLSTIFDPFYTTKEKDGVGLGLSIVWGIIEKHGGQINVESELDKGTTFTIRLPVADIM